MSRPSRLGAVTQAAGRVVGRVFARGNRELNAGVARLRDAVAALEPTSAGHFASAREDVSAVRAQVAQVRDALSSRLDELQRQLDLLQAELESAHRLHHARLSAAQDVFGSPPALRPIPGWHTGWGTETHSTLLQERLRLWSALRHPVLMRWHADLLVTIYPGNELSKVLFLTGNFEPNELTWMSRTLTEGMVVIDVGAHMGMYSMFAAKHVGPSGLVLAIEPSAREFERLTNHVRVNDLRNVRCLPAAASDSDAEATLRIASEWNSGHNTLGDFYRTDVESIGQSRVPTHTLDAIVAAEQLERVDVIKIDAEGHELRVLTGAEATLQRFRPHILIEVFGEVLLRQGASVDAVLGLLRRHDYDLSEFSESTGEPVRASRVLDNQSRNLIAIPR